MLYARVSACVSGAHACVHHPEGRGDPPVTPCLIPWRQDLSGNLKLDWRANPSGLSASNPTETGNPVFHTGAGIRTRPCAS